MSSSCTVTASPNAYCSVDVLSVWQRIGSRDEWDTDWEGGLRGDASELQEGVLDGRANHWPGRINCSRHCSQHAGFCSP